VLRSLVRCRLDGTFQCSIDCVDRGFLLLHANKSHPSPRKPSRSDCVGFVIVGSCVEDPLAWVISFGRVRPRVNWLEDKVPVGKKFVVSISICLKLGHSIDSVVGFAPWSKGSRKSSGRAILDNFSLCKKIDIALRFTENRSTLP
jgi:hypothetical protein